MPRIIGSAQPAVHARAPASPRPVSFRPAEVLETSVKEASDVVALPDGRFAVVGDRSDKLALVSRSGAVERVELPHVEDGKSQFEGLAFDPVNNRLFASREESRELLRFAWSPKRAERPRLEERIDLSVGGPANKGVEGLAYLPASKSPTGAAGLLLAREGKPRQLLLARASGKGALAEVRLPDAVREACKDFSAVAVDPKSGDVFLASDESGAVAQLHLSRTRDGLSAALVGAFPVRGADGKRLARIEGLTFDARGDLFVLTENDGRLHRFARQ